MTKGELVYELTRLGKGFEVDIRPTQFEAFYELFQATNTLAFRQAVTHLLCGPRYPSLAHMQEAVEKAEEDLRKAAVERGRHAAGLWMAGHGLVKSRDEDEYQYGLFRMKLLRESIGAGPRDFAKHHFEGIREWLNDDAHQLWAAKTVSKGPCGHPEEHKTLLKCLLAECSLWEARYKAIQEPEPAQARQEVKNEP